MSEWIRMKDLKPSNRLVLVTTYKGEVIPARREDTNEWVTHDGRHCLDEDVVAWCELPSPYKTHAMIIRDLKEEMRGMTQDITPIEIMSHDGENLKNWCFAWRVKMMALISQIEEGD